MNPVWGLLLKSLTSNETIEQAIARLITAHNDDEEAHTGVGQSLQSHKASEIIDHLAASIVSDKYALQSVGLSALNWDKIQIIPDLNSVDAWVSSLGGSGSALTPEVASVKLITGNINTNKSYFTLPVGSYLESDPEGSPFFEFKASIVDYGIADFRIMNKGLDPFVTTGDNFGFECLYNDSDVYAIYQTGGVKHRFALGVSTPASWHRYRAELVDGSSAGKYTINFYVDGVFVDSFVDVTFYPSASYVFAVGVISRTITGENPIISLANLVYCVGWPV